MTTSDDWGMVGHAWAVASLQRAVERGAGAHAYLFTGLPGVGRTTLARVLARALLCSGAGARPCGICRACRLVDSGNHPDLQIVEAEREGGTLKTGEVEDWQRQVALTPAMGARRVTLFRRFEEANAHAANRLLKTLEEPPAYLTILIVARDPGLLLPTIVSRCQQVPLRPLPADLIEEALRARWQVEPERARLLAHLACGRLGWAVRAAADPQVLVRRARQLDDLAGLMQASLVGRFQYAEEVARDPGRVAETLALWSSWFRDLLLETSGAQVERTHVDRREELRAQAQRLGIEHASAALDALHRTSTLLQTTNANPRLVLEVLMLDLPGL